MYLGDYFLSPSFLTTHLATKFWGGSIWHELAFIVCQASWDIIIFLSRSQALSPLFCSGKRSQSLLSWSAKQILLRSKVTTQDGDHGKNYRERSIHVNQRFSRLTNYLCDFLVMLSWATGQRKSNTEHNWPHGRHDHAWPMIGQGGHGWARFRTRLSLSFDFSRIIFARLKNKRSEKRERERERESLGTRLNSS